MKLILTVVHDEDAQSLIHNLSNAGFSTTKLASTGGFLKKGNTTLFIGTQEKKVNDVIQIIKDTCNTTTEMSIVNPPSSTPEGYLPYPVEITVGGATIFVLDVEQYIKI